MSDETLDLKSFPNKGDVSCGHTVGLYKSGRCRSCGTKVFDSLKKRAHKLGLIHTLRHYTGRNILR